MSFRVTALKLFVFSGYGMVRLQITLDANEARLLAEWAAAELRDPRDQIRLIVRESLQERGLLESEKTPQAAPAHADVNTIEVGHELD
jgi:hypothetical protein